MNKPADQTQTDANKFLVLPIIILVMAQMGTVGDNGAVAISADALTNNLGASMSDIQMANMVYSLVAGAFMTAGGLMGTIIGWKKNFRIGAVLCALGEIVMALSSNMNMFVWGGRVLVGLGASFMSPSELGLIPLIYKPEKRVLAFSCLGAAVGLGAFLPLILGIVMEYMGYKVTFLVLAVYFIVVFVLSFRLPAIEQDESGLKFDGIGVGMAAVGLFSFLLGISKISEWGLITPFINAPFTLFGCSPCLFMVLFGLVDLYLLLKVERQVEKKNGNCLIPICFTHNPQVIAGLVASALTFFFMGVQSILMGPYLLLVAGWSPVQVGITSLVIGLPTFAFAFSLPRIFPLANPRRVICSGYIVMAIALVVLRESITINGVVDWGIYLGSFIAGCGAGTVSSQDNNIVALAIDERDACQSGGIQATMRNVGQAIGVAVLGVVLMFGISSGMSKMAEAKGVSSHVVEQVVKMDITLAGNNHFIQETRSIQMNQTERNELVESYVKARYEATRNAYIVAICIMLSGVYTTRWITVFSKPHSEDKEVVKLRYNKKK